MSLERTIRGVLTEQTAPKEITEAGHDDVSMAKTKVKIAMAAVQKMSAELDKLPDDGDLPSWWVGKVAIAVDKLDGMADYLDTQVEEVQEETLPGKGKDTWMKDGVEMCPEECCGQPVTECKCGTDCKTCNCAERKEMMKAEATIPDGQTAMTKKPEISKSDKDKIAKIADMMSKEKKNKTEAYNEPQGQAKSMMSPLHKARMDKEKADRDRDGKLKPGVVKVKKEEVEVEEAKKVSSMQIHKVLAPTKNSREGIAALKKAFRVNDREAQMMMKKVMNEESLDEISRTMTPMRKKFGGTVDPKKFDMYKKHIKQHRVDEPTVRMVIDNPDDAESKRMMKNKHVAQAVSLRKAAMKESVAGKIRNAMMKNEKFANAAQQAAVMAKLKASGKYKKEEVQEAKKPDETVNIRQSLKKAIDMRGQKEVVFKDGSKAKISVQDAEKAMKMLDTTRMAKAKQDLTVRMMKSHQDFKDTLAGKKPKVDPFALRVRKEDNNPKIVKHLEMAKKARAEGDYDKANYHTQLARQMQSENTFISKFKEEIKEKKRMSETKGAPKGYHFTRSGQLKKGDAGQDGDGGKMLRSDPLDKQRKKIPPLPENDK